MSNRSKKNVFIKEPNDTLKKVRISPELRNQIMELVTGTKPKNGKDSLKWSLEHEQYLIAEDKVTNDVAKYITSKRQELYADVASWNSNASHDFANTDTPSREWRMNAKESDRVIIPKEIFNEYWTEKKEIEKQLKEYAKISKLHSDIRTCKIVDEYVYCVLRVVQHKYGSQLGVKTFGIDDYNTILKLYEQHKDEHNLTYPGFPEEHLINQVKIPDEPRRPHKKI